MPKRVEPLSAATSRAPGVSPDGPAVRVALEAVALLRRRAGVAWNPTALAVSDMLRAARRAARD
jgi:hypothetical protein